MNVTLNVICSLIVFDLRFLLNFQYYYICVDVHGKEVKFEYFWDSFCKNCYKFQIYIFIVIIPWILY